jgi:hypothetical protein
MNSSTDTNDHFNGGEWLIKESNFPRIMNGYFENVFNVFAMIDGEKLSPSNLKKFRRIC